MGIYLTLIAVVFAINLLPAFGPPTWALLVWFELTYGLSAPVIVALGALTAASGRLVLALAAVRLRGRLSPHRLESLSAASAVLHNGSRRRIAASLGVFFVSPLPSGQLFLTAGLLALPLRGLALAFLAGRLVSYSIFVAAGGAANASLGDVATDALRSPIGIAIQVACCCWSSR